MIVNYADHSANERTFLAWVRTAVAVVGFGLAAGRLQKVPAPVWSELLMLAMGAVVVVAYLRMRRLRARINAAEAADDDGLAADTLLLALLGAFFVLLTTFAVHAG